MGVKVRGKVIPVSFLKVEGRETLIGAKDWRGQIEELEDHQKPGPKAPPMSRKGKERREQRRCQGRSN